MPRARKTLSGAKAMGVVDVPGQMYGKGVEQQALQKAMPAPQAQQPKAVPPQPARQRQVPAAAPAPNAEASMANAMAALRGKIGFLANDTEVPDEPVTAGMRRGPGPGPEVLTGNVGSSPLGEFLRTISRASGDAYFASLADRAGL